MPIVDGVRVISRIYQVSQARQHEIAEHWRAIERERARKRLARALKPKAGTAGGPPTAEEREQYRELSVDLCKRIVTGADLDDAGMAAVECRIWAWMRSRPRVPWYQFVEMMRVTLFEQPHPKQPPACEIVTQGRQLHRMDGW